MPSATPSPSDENPESLPPSVTAPAEQPKTIEDAPDAPRREIVAYSLGGITNGIAEGMNHIFLPVLTIALGMNPLLIGVILGIKTIWDSVTDPVMAYISDNCRTRWGRRRPFILVGGIAMPVVILLTWLAVPESQIRYFNRQIAETDTAAAVAPPIDAPSTQTAPAITPENAPPEIEPPVKQTPAQETPVLKKGTGSLIHNLSAGFHEVLNSDAETMHLFWVLLAGSLALATASTIYGSSYHALGIELCPSYDGRTRVVIYRSVAGKLMGLVKQWIQPFVLSGLFVSAVHGMIWYGAIGLVLGGGTVFAAFYYTRERTPIIIQATEETTAERMGFFKGMWMVVTNFHIVRVFLLQKIVGISNGTFSQLGIFINIYYVWGGREQAGSTFAATVASVGWLIGFIMLPVTSAACKKFEKHRIFAFSIGCMIVGSVLNWFVYVPGKPEYQLFVPIFNAVGLTAFYTVLQTMYADLTDMDELKTGERREAMIGATMSFFNKFIDVFQGILPGLVLVAAGFAIERGADQADGVFRNMRIFFSVVPALLLGCGLLLLWNYPLNRKRINEVKHALAIRRAKQSQAKQS